MSDRPWWKRPLKKSPDDVVAERTKEIEDRGRAPSLGGREHRRGGGTPRSVIFSQKMTIPKGKK